MKLEFGNNLHVLSLLFFLIPVFFIPIWTKQLTPKSQSIVQKNLAYLGVILIPVYLIYWLGFNFDVHKSLPLFPCDILLLLSPLALFFKVRWVLTLYYFFGIFLSPQAFITPSNSHGPDTFGYWLYWLGHAYIFCIAVFNVVVINYRPHLRDYLVLLGAAGWYGLLLFPLNYILGSNYGFIGSENLNTISVLDFFGTWPERLYIIYVGFIVVTFIAWIIWPISNKLYAVVNKACY